MLAWIGSGREFRIEPILKCHHRCTRVDHADICNYGTLYAKNANLSQRNRCNCCMVHLRQVHVQACLESFRGDSPISQAIPVLASFQPLTNYYYSLLY